MLDRPPRWPRLQPVESVVVISLLAAVVAVGWFDLQTNLPLLDEWARRWTIEKMAAGQGIKPWGFSPDLVQSLAALPLALAHVEPRFWRLVGLPALAVEALAAGLIARRLGASRAWVMLAAAAVVASPLNLSLATGLMTETFFIPLFLLAIWASLRWVEDGSMAMACAAFVILAALERQQALGIAAATTAAVILARRGRPRPRADVLPLAVMWIGTLGVLAGSYWLRSRVGGPTPGPSKHLAGVAFDVYAVASLAPMLGLLALPLAVGVALMPVGPGTSRWRLVAVTIAILGLGFGWLISLPERGHLLPGNIFDTAGLGATIISGKVSLLPPGVFLGLEVLVSVTFITLLVVKSGSWSPGNLAFAEGVIIANVAIQVFAVIAQGQVFDRYYILILAPLLPMLAAWAARGTRGNRLAAWTGAGVIVVGLVYYVAGEQDYLAWQQARHLAANEAYSRVAPDQVAAGVEEEAAHLYIPAADNPMQPLPEVVSDHPALTLRLTGPNDPRPGYSYWSLAPGKVIVVKTGG